MKSMFKSRRFVSAILAAAVVMATVTVSSVVSIFAAGEFVITQAEPCITLNAGETKSLSGGKIEFTSGELTDVSQVTWEPVSSGVTIDGGQIKADAKGVYEVKATAGGKSMSVYAVAKAANETDYELFFDDFDGTWNNQYDLIEGKADSVSMKDGFLYLDATAAGNTNVRVLFPEFLENFGNYRIDVKTTQQQPTDSARWNSIMFRVANNDYPYYHMAVRSNATTANGVELTERTPTNGWSVIQFDSGYENINPDKLYTYSVLAKDGVVQEQIDGNAIIHATGVTKHTKGRVGIQCNQSIMKVDSVRITLQQDTPAKPADKPAFVDVRDVETGITLPTSLIADVSTKAQLDALSTTLPATAVLHVNESMKVVNADTGAEISGVEAALAGLNNKVIPAFYVKDKATVDNLIPVLRKIKMEDAFLIADNKELTAYARSQYPILRSVLDYSNLDKTTLTEADMLDIRRDVNIGKSKIVILPDTLAVSEYVNYLIGHQVTVWVKAAGGTLSKTDAVRLITSGAYGIICGDTATVESCMKDYFAEDSLIRTPLIVGHRGNPTKAPENTMEGYKMAVENGASVVECDVYLTKDNEVVIMHDSTVDRTTNGKGNIESFTLAELKQLLANKQFPNDPRFANARIPTLKELFTEFADKGIQMFIEVKSGKSQIVSKMIDLIDEYKVEDQVTIISFSTAQLTQFQAEMPGMSVGYLCEGMVNTNAEDSVRKVLSSTQQYNSTFNPSTGGLNSNFIKAASHRGMTVWPWTYSDQGTTDIHIMMGVNALTSNAPQFTKNYVSSISSPESSREVKLNESIPLQLSGKTYGGTVSDLSSSANVIVLEGADNITVNGNAITGKADGIATVMLSYQGKLTYGEYMLYTQPITIKVGNASETTTTATETTTTTTEATTTTTTTPTTTEPVTTTTETSTVTETTTTTAQQTTTTTTPTSTQPTTTTTTATTAKSSTTTQPATTTTEPVTTTIVDSTEPDSTEASTTEDNVVPTNGENGGGTDNSNPNTGSANAAAGLVTLFAAAAGIIVFSKKSKK